MVSSVRAMPGVGNLPSLRPLPVHTVELTVPFHDVDAIEMVWHGNYVKYLEAARDGLLEELGHGYLQMRASGYFWPVIELKMRYLQPARLRQRLSVSAAITDYEARLRIAYQVTDAATGRRLMRAHSVQVPVRIDTGTIEDVVYGVFA